MKVLKKLLPLLRDFVRRADMFLFTMSVICAVYGIIVIASATQSYANGSAQYVIVQTLALGLGVLLFIAMTVIDVDIFAQHWAWLYGLSAALLISLIFFGAQSDTGNNGWLRFFGIGIQPTEIVKIAFIIVMAKQLSYLKEYKNLNSVTSIAQIVVHFVLMFGLILVTAQDLGSALVYFFIFAVMLFVAGVRIYWFIIGLAALAGMVPILWTYFLEDYQKDRIWPPMIPALTLTTRESTGSRTSPRSRWHPASSPERVWAKVRRASPPPSPVNTRTSSLPLWERSLA